MDIKGFKINFLGDSITEGVGVPQTLSWDHSFPHDSECSGCHALCVYKPHRWLEHSSPLPLFCQAVWSLEPMSLLVP